MVAATAGRLRVVVMTAGVLALAVILTVIASAGGHTNRDAVPLTDAQLTAMTKAATSCPAISAARLAGEVMALTGFEPTVDGGIAGLSADEWDRWKPWDDAVPSDDTASLLALAHLTCDLVGHLRRGGFAGDLWPFAVAALASSLADVRAAAGIPTGAAEVVSRAQAYALEYAEQVIPQHTSDSTPQKPSTAPSSAPSPSASEPAPTLSTAGTSGPPAPTSPAPTSPSTSTSTSTSAPSDFAIALSPTSASVVQGATTTVTVTTAVTAGSAQPLTLSASNLPAGATASFSPTTVSAGGSSTLTLRTSGSTPTGTATVTVTASGSTSRTASLQLTVTPAVTCSSPGQKLRNPGFESGTTAWSTTQGVIGRFDEQRPHGGTRVAWLGGHGHEHTDTLSQSVTLPAGCDRYTFSFWLHIESNEASSSSVVWDRMRVQVRTAGGTVVTLASYSNLDDASGYRLRSFDLADYAGQTVQLLFIATEDESRLTSFVVDDTAVDVA